MRTHLKLLNATQLVDLPVGENVHDHVNVRLPPIDVQDRTVFKYSVANVSFEDFDEFKSRGTGFLAAFDARHEAFIASTRAKEIEGFPDWPDIQLYLQATYFTGTGNGSTAYCCAFPCFTVLSLHLHFRLPFLQCEFEPGILPGQTGAKYCGNSVAGKPSAIGGLQFSEQ